MGLDFHLDQTFDRRVVFSLAAEALVILVRPGAVAFNFISVLFILYRL